MSAKTLIPQIPLLDIGDWCSFNVPYGQGKFKHKGIQVQFKGYESVAIMSVVMWPASYDINLALTHKEKEKMVTLYRHTDISEPPCLSNEQMLDIAKQVGSDLLEELVKQCLTEDLEKRYPWIHNPDFSVGE
ncbi:hypothetical protein [Acaryochloris marina]|nr:hypothetical protein [Acaryochloris marina]